MTIITLNGKVTKTMGNLPMVGDEAPNFTLAHSKMEEISILTSFPGRSLLLYMFPSVDNPFCEKTLLKINQMAANLTNTVVLCISNDIPFAQQRFSTNNKTDHITFLSAFRSSEFGRQDGYGTLISDGCFRGLLARAAVAINPEGRIIYSELVQELNNEPNYETCFATVRKTDISTNSIDKDFSPGDRKHSSETSAINRKRLGENSSLMEDLSYLSRGISYFENSYQGLKVNKAPQNPASVLLIFSPDKENNREGREGKGAQTPLELSSKAGLGLPENACLFSVLKPGKEMH